MTSKTLPLFAAALFSAGAVMFTMGAAWAGPNCTNAPKSEWLSEDAMKQKITEMGYKNIREFKSTKGNCYEIYGYDKDGKKAEVYFNPITGDIVEAK